MSFKMPQNVWNLAFFFSFFKKEEFFGWMWISTVVVAMSTSIASATPRRLQVRHVESVRGNWSAEQEVFNWARHKFSGEILTILSFRACRCCTSNERRAIRFHSVCCYVMNATFCVSLFLGTSKIRRVPGPRGDLNRFARFGCFLSKTLKTHHKK